MFKKAIIAVLIASRLLSPMASVAEEQHQFNELVQKQMKTTATDLIVTTAHTVYEMCPNRANEAMDETLEAALEGLEFYEQIKPLLEGNTNAFFTKILSRVMKKIESNLTQKYTNSIREDIGLQSHLSPNYIEELSKHAAKAYIDEVGCKKEDRSKLEKDVGEEIYHDTKQANDSINNVVDKTASFVTDNAIHDDLLTYIDDEAHEMVGLKSYAVDLKVESTEHVVKGKDAEAAIHSQLAHVWHLKLQISSKSRSQNHAITKYIEHERETHPHRHYHKVWSHTGTYTTRAQYTVKDTHGPDHTIFITARQVH